MNGDAIRDTAYIKHSINDGAWELETVQTAGCNPSRPVSLETLLAWRGPRVPAKPYCSRFPGCLERAERPSALSRRSGKQNPNREDFPWNSFISTLLFGISVGGQYALIAIGYTMVYGILRLINFAHGDVFMVAGLMGIYLTSGLTPYLPLAAVIPASLVLVLILTVALGFCIERVAYKPLRSAPRMSVMISAIGVSYLLQNTATYVTGGQPMTYPTLPFLCETVTIAGTPIKWVVILTPFLVVALVIVLTQLINHTKIGMAMRAVAKDFETSQLMGIKINSVISATFVIGSALAAIGSMLYFTTYPAIVPTSGAMPGLKAFVAAVFGGIGSIPGAVIGAFLIGICENFVKILPFEGATTFVDAFTFALLIVILVFKPTGLFGEKATDKV